MSIGPREKRPGITGRGERPGGSPLGAPAVLAVLAGVAMLAACGQAPPPHPLTATPTDGWPTNGGDFYNRRGSLTTAGGLVFVGRSDGRLTALDSSDGTMLWEFQTGAGMNSVPSAFEHEGRQYVVAYSAGNMFAGSAKGDSVWLFSLDGTLDAVEPGTVEPR